MITLSFSCILFYFKYFLLERAFALIFPALSCYPSALPCLSFIPLCFNTFTSNWWYLLPIQSLFCLDVPSPFTHPFHHSLHYLFSLHFFYPSSLPPFYLSSTSGLLVTLLEMAFAGKTHAPSNQLQLQLQLQVDIRHLQSLHCC